MNIKVAAFTVSEKSINTSKSIFASIVVQLPWIIKLVCRSIMLSADFFNLKKINVFEKNLSGIPSESQTVWVQIRPNVMSGLIWIQTACKGYQQTTLVGMIINFLIKGGLA